MSKNTTAMITIKSLDLENQTKGNYRADHDPYKLLSGLKNIDEIALSHANQTNNKAQRFKCFLQLLRIDLGHGQKFENIKNFYENQNKTIEHLIVPVSTQVEKAGTEEADYHIKIQIAIYASFASSLILVVLQIYAAVSSRSLSLFTAMADAIFDPLSNLTLIISSQFIKSMNLTKFPSGKSRVETLGNISFCFIMTFVSLILIIFSVRELADSKFKNELNAFHLPSLIVVTTAFLIKLSLFLYCWGLKDRHSSVKILWKDHRNDLIVTGFGIIMSLLGSKVYWWIDPAGAIMISIVIICVWLRTLRDEFLLIIGITAPPHIRQLITYISMTNSPEIEGVETVRAYYSGPKIITEVNIIMRPNVPLRIAHDVAEVLRFKLEQIPDIGKAYVNLDCDTIYGSDYKS